jgi:hypothetical protein
MPAEVPQQRSEERCHVDGRNVMRLEAAVEAQVLALRGHGEGGQRRDPVMLVAIGDDGGLSGGSPCPAARGDEENATLIETGEMGTKASGCFFSSATGRRSNAQWPVRRAGWPGARAPDSSSPGRAESSRCVWGNSAPHSGAESRPRGVSTSPARGESRLPWRPAATAAPMARVARRAMGAEPQAPAWAPRPSRLLPARPRATDTPRSPMPAPDARPRSSSPLGPGAPRCGVAVVPMSWVSPRVS